MYTIMALICSIGIPHNECFPQTARDVYVLGKDLSQFQCLLYSQMTDGRVSLNIGPDEYHKYMCIKQ